jgi:hypothetical protein
LKAEVAYTELDKIDSWWRFDILQNNTHEKVKHLDLFGEWPSHCKFVGQAEFQAISFLMAQVEFDVVHLYEK